MSARISAKRAPQYRRAAYWRGRGLTEALVAILVVRYREFRAHFGRNPDPQEPLFFAVNGSSRPKPATANETRRQIMTAAAMTGVDPRPLLKFMGLVVTPRRRRRP